MKEKYKELDNTNRMLIEVVENVARELQIDVKELPTDYSIYFIEAESSNPDRCVDGRKPQKDEERIYKGFQLAGATAGYFDVVKSVTGLSEWETRRYVASTYKSNDLTMGMHGDIEHGKMGCGDQRVKSESKVKMTTGVSEDLISERQDFVLKNDGIVFNLKDKHAEGKAIINLEKDTTFDTVTAVDDEMAAFSCDVRAFYERAGLLFDELHKTNTNHKGPKEKEKFQEVAAEALVRNYLQTAKALVPDLTEVFVH